MGSSSGRKWGSSKIAAAMLARGRRLPESSAGGASASAGRFSLFLSDRPQRLRSRTPNASRSLVEGRPMPRSRTLCRAASQGRFLAQSARLSDLAAPSRPSVNRSPFISWRNWWGRRCRWRLHRLGVGILALRGHGLGLRVLPRGRGHMGLLGERSPARWIPMSVVKSGDRVSGSRLIKGSEVYRT